MAVSSGFFNSINHDRLYDAEQVSSLFDGLILDGVYESIGSAFMVRPNEEVNDSVIVGTGRAWFNHTWTLNDADFSITIDPPNTLYARKDFVVIDVDKTSSVRANSIKVVRGTMGENPEDPVIVNTDEHHQYPIARITVPAGVSGIILQDNIEYLVGTEQCPLVTGVVEALNLTNYLAQYDAQFNTWFEGIKDIFDEDPMTAFQNQIDDLKDKIDSIVPYMTKSVFDKLISGKDLVNISTFNIPINSDGYHYSPNRIVGAILPDGKICHVSFDYDDSSDTRVTTLFVALYDNSGVKLAEKSSILQSLHFYKPLEYTPFNVINVSVDTYPSVITVGFIGMDQVVSSVITITENNVINISVNTQSAPTKSDTRYSVVARPARLPDGRSYGALVVLDTGGRPYITDVYSVAISPDGTIYISSSILHKSESSSGSNLFWGYFTNCGIYCYYANDLIYVEPLGQLTDSYTTERYDEQLEMLLSTTINQIKYETSNVSSYDTTMGKPRLSVDPYTLELISESPDEVSAPYDTLYNATYKVLSDGVLKTYKYNYSTTAEQSSSESMKCIDVSNSPNLVNVSNIVFDQRVDVESHLVGVANLKSTNIANSSGTNLITGAIVSNYSTGISEKYTVSLKPGSSNTEVTSLFPYLFYMRNIENTSYLMIIQNLLAARTVGYCTAYAYEGNSIAKIIKVTF